MPQVWTCDRRRRRLPTTLLGLVIVLPHGQMPLDRSRRFEAFPGARGSRLPFPVPTPP